MPSNEQGFSLVELLIAVAILALAGQQYASRTVQQEQNAMVQSAQKDARDQLLTSLNMIRKNLKAKVADTAVDVTAHRLSFEQELADRSQSKITISSLCRKVAGETFVPETPNPADATCLESLACEGLPYLEIVTESGGRETSRVSYPSVDTMNRQLKKQIGVAGSVLCFATLGDRIKVHGLQLVHGRSKDGPIKLTVQGMIQQIPMQSRNSISFIR